MIQTKRIAHIRTQEGDIMFWKFPNNPGRSDRSSERSQYSNVRYLSKTIAMLFNIENLDTPYLGTLDP